jgi:NADPH:quinone reductase-like Zn-dependent oxidoreductase
VIGAVVRAHELELERDLPEPANGDVLVEIEAACISRLDLQIAAGAFPLRPRAPYIPCTDGSGRIAATGERVWIRGAGVGMTRHGCCAERVSLPREALHPLVGGVDAVAAATFFVPCSTAHVALHDVGKLREGETVGIRGAGGAVGQVAVQMALAAGAGEVIGIVPSEESAANVPSGARVVVSPRGERLTEASIDLLVDTVCGPAFAACLAAVRPRGRVALVGYAGGVDLALDATSLLVRDVALLPVNGMSREPDSVPRARDWLDALERGELVLPTEAYPLERLDDAVEAVVASPSRGRIAVTLGTSPESAASR